MASPLIGLIMFMVGSAILWTIVNFFTRDMQLPLYTVVWWLLVSRGIAIIVGILLLAIIGEEEAVAIIWVLEEIISTFILYFFLRSNYSEVAYKILGTFLVIMILGRIVLTAI